MHHTLDDENEDEDEDDERAPSALRASPSS